MSADVERALDRIVETGTGQLGIPELEAAPAEEIVALQINAETPIWAFLVHL